MLTQASLASEKVPMREILFLSMVSALPPLSTDMYLGAMPTISAQWQASTLQINLSLILWFAAFSVALPFFGPLSDKFGRKPILLGGLVIFMLGSIGCAASTDVIQLITFRILQGIGAAGPSAMTMAIARDKYHGHQRKLLLAYMGVIVALAPMVAPLIGTLILQVASWRSIFILQGIIAFVIGLRVLGFTETMTTPLQDRLYKLMLRYRVVLGNRRYMLANTTMGLLAGPLFGFIAMSPHIYTEEFRLSESTFSLYFAFNALMLMAGAFACTRLNRVISDTPLITACIISSIIGALGILAIGPYHPMLFAITMGLVTFANGVTRPLSNHLILDQVQTDIGTASSFSVFYVFVVGAVSMALVSLPQSHMVRSFGFFALAVPSVVLMVWPLLLKQLSLTKKPHGQEEELITIESTD